MMFWNIDSLSASTKKNDLALTLVLPAILIASCGTHVVSSNSEADSGNNGRRSGTQTLVAKMDTVFKVSIEESVLLESTQKCQIDAGSEIQVSALDLEGTHAKITLFRDSQIPNCNLRTGFIFAEHFSGIPESIFSKPTRALLSTIALAEGTNDRYDLIYSFKTFSSYADHPRRIYCSGGLCSNAAGRYQFLDSTWDETRSAANLSDFSPLNQDKGAVYRIQTFRGVTEHGNAIGRAAFERMIYKLNNEWASLPGSPYGQPTKSMSTLWSHYVAKL